MPARFKPKLYKKDESFDPFFKTVNWRFYAKLRLYPSILVLLGILILLTQVILPVIFFTTQDQIPKPISSSVLGIATGFGEFEFKELDNKAVGNIWEMPQTNAPDFFYITIPKLNIIDTLVETNPIDLRPDNALGRYKGTSLPGEPGNTFIYGHSALPIFYNPKNYKTIFSTLNDLEIGDEFYIKYNNRTLTYKVLSKDLLPPEEVNPLAEIRPKYLNESTIVLMTCWPPGTINKRLMINAIKVD
jgi:LPXTG-site transpeptidase (sortase) family protein